MNFWLHLKIHNICTACRSASITSTFPNDDEFNAKAALEAGFSPEVVALLPKLPYLDFDNEDGALEILPATDPVNYLGKSCDVGTFKWFRIMDDDPLDDNHQIPDYSFRLSIPGSYELTPDAYEASTLIYNIWTRELSLN